jgi:hypothetical protein
MPRLTIRLSDTLHEALTRHADALGMLVSDLARTCIAKCLTPADTDDATALVMSDTAETPPAPQPTALPQAYSPSAPLPAAIHHTSRPDDGQLSMARCGKHAADGTGQCPQCR